MPRRSLSGTHSLRKISSMRRALMPSLAFCATGWLALWFKPPLTSPEPNRHKPVNFPAKKKRPPLLEALYSGVLGEIRTSYPLVRRQVLNPDELRLN